MATFAWPLHRDLAPWPTYGIVAYAPSARDRDEQNAVEMVLRCIMEG